VHRRLAARNILLNFMNEVKISGFGPQPEHEEAEGDEETGKRVRKWDKQTKMNVIDTPIFRVER